MKKLSTHILALFLILSVFAIPAVSFAQNDLVPCGNPGQAECGFNDLIKLVINIINTLITYSTYIAVAVFCYAGIMLMTAGGDKGALDKAKKILGSVVKGYVWILIAWVVVYTIMNTLIDGEGFSLLGDPQ
ncbi:MAG: hypothetical protein AB200_00215 [Parcubacteria bacterium C7867-005]|nr:MAG: hypothetical protein AB200_00215 [Parcubacteria bacterium C7867-005]